MTSAMIMEPECSKRDCKHFLGADGYEEEDQVLICEAFPGGIPHEIAFGGNKHTEPYEGDHGVMYEKR